MTNTCHSYQHCIVINLVNNSKVSNPHPVKNLVPGQLANPMWTRIFTQTIDHWFDTVLNLSR
jgi:hypothetical protein